MLATPLVIFPPWINRFYILDLTPEKSFIRWAVEQGITVFMVSWKSADASMKDVIWDDYVAAQIDAIDTVRDAARRVERSTPSAIASPAPRSPRRSRCSPRGGRRRRSRARPSSPRRSISPRRATAQLHRRRAVRRLIERLSPDGFLDGRYMAATFNLLRGRDLIWNYVTNNYLLGKDYAPFDLLHWNGDTTNLPAEMAPELSDATCTATTCWSSPARCRVGGTPIDLTKVETPAYVQAGREDHIAPAESVWKITDHFAGPMTFVLAGSGHIAGVVNPPAAAEISILDQPERRRLARRVRRGRDRDQGQLVARLDRLAARAGRREVAATGARHARQGQLKAIEDAPGQYVRAR